MSFMPLSAPRSCRSARRLLGAAALALTVAACAPDDAVDAAQLLMALDDRDAAARDGAGAPQRVMVAWAREGRSAEGDLYTPGEGDARAALVLAPGLGREGRRDVRLVALATALAREGFAILVPDVPGFQAQRISASDSDLLADALRHLLARPEGTGPVGIAAVSYAVGPAMLAALAPDLAPRLDVIVAIGGYYDSEAVVTFFTTGYFRERPDAPWQHRRPNAFGKWVFVRANADRIESAPDRVALAAMAQRKLADLDASVEDLTVNLGVEGRAVVDLLANQDPARVPALIAALPAAVRNDLRGLSLAGREFGALGASVILIHGRDDAIIPYTESVALARALPEDQANVVLLDNLAHADLGPGGLADAARLWRAVYLLMRARRDR